MKRILICTLLALTVSTSWSQTYVPSDGVSSVIFKIKHFGLQTEGSFKGLKGNIIFNTADLSNAHIDVTLDAATINTGTKLRDNNLRSEEYFNVNEFPTLQFKSTRIDAGKSQGEFILTGNLFIKGTAKQISFPFILVQGKDGYQVKGEFKINRRDFSVGKSSIAMADEVLVELSVLVLRQPYGSIN